MSLKWLDKVPAGSAEHGEAEDDLDFDMEDNNSLVHGASKDNGVRFLSNSRTSLLN